MKKIVLACGVAAAILGVTSACSDNGSTGVSNSFADSLSVSLGQSQGMRLAADYNTSLPEEEKAKMRKDDILRGIKQVIMTDTTQQGYLSGLSIGLQVAGQLMRYEEAGIPVNRAKVYEAYAKAFSADSVNVDELRAIQQQFQTLAQQAQEKMMEYYTAQQEAERKAKAEAPEAVENTKAGAEYIKKAAAADPDVKVTPSGLAYKVITEGTGEPVGENGRATVKYKGQLIDGTVFDSNDSGVVFSPRQVVPGFGEGLAMMKKGSHYVLMIPGELAYGVDGAPQAGIGPNATLVFDVEVTDIQK